MRFIQCGYNTKHPSSFQVNSVIAENFGHRFRILLIKNNCVVQINDKLINDLKKNTLLLVQSGTFLHCVSNDNYYLDDWIEFSAELSEIEDLGLISDFVVSGISDEEGVSIGKIIQLLETEHLKRAPFFQEYCDAYLKILLVDISRYLNNYTPIVSTKVSHALYKKLLKMRNQILNNATKDISISKICEQNNISESHFRRSYKDVFNTTIQRDIIEKRVTLSQEYLKTRYDLSCTQIADIIGYKNYEHFFRQFKKETGMTPIEYRNRFS